MFEGNVLSIQRKTNLDRLSSMGEADDLSFSLIIFYVLKLTPRLHRSKDALQRSENIIVLVICRTETRVIRKTSSWFPGVWGEVYRSCTKFTR